MKTLQDIKMGKLINSYRRKIEMSDLQIENLTELLEKEDSQILRNMTLAELGKEQTARTFYVQFVKDLEDYL